MFEVQIKRDGVWERHGMQHATRAEAEDSHKLVPIYGAACDGRDAYGNLLPDNPSRVVEVFEVEP